MHDSQGHQATTPALRRQRMRPLALLAIAPLALGLIVTGCTAIEDTTDYIGDLFSYVEDDDEVFGSDDVSSGDEPTAQSAKCRARRPPFRVRKSVSS